MRPRLRAVRRRQPWLGQPPAGSPAVLILRPLVVSAPKPRQLLGGRLAWVRPALQGRPPALIPAAQVSRPVVPPRLRAGRVLVLRALPPNPVVSVGGLPALLVSVPRVWRPRRLLLFQPPLPPLVFRPDRGFVLPAEVPSWPVFAASAGTSSSLSAAGTTSFALGARE